MPERLLFAINGNGESRLPTFPAMRSSPSSRQWPFILNGYFLAISLRIESALQVATHGTETGERSAKEHNGRTTIRDISSSAFFKERPLGKPETGPTCRNRDTPAQITDEPNYRTLVGTIVLGKQVIRYASRWAEIYRCTKTI